ncbi:hypothetical protein BDA96_10G069000 [Sorghum bicolor]|jgi:hypothetical protein|uniref:Rx N-terminal domain-containing protein n=1 Tax=Sorghum bicolor TaxID=4558 RepID=A0A921Q3E3_SORBI|nr:putative disease resistance RPP13-like protein 1 [Sorghum bicolor]KAG0513066.1 hypothetical protein BDA96_10G069000 [Sorghum bicolor]|eukprot:XP_021305415.1 putative disease resistance RPP13-like protein 1 [Sorghum bicolor]
MEALRNALLSELAGRAVSFLVSTCGSRLMPVPATVQEREESLMHRLQLLLLRSATIVEEAEGRRVTNHGVLRQLRVLSDAMVRGHYVLDTVRYDAGGGYQRQQEEDGSKEKEVVPAFALSRFTLAKRARCESSSETTTTASPARRRDTSLQLQRMVRSLEAILAGAMELAVFLTACPPMSCRQPYSAHLFLDKCMFGRHAERDQVLEFLLQAEPPAPVTVTAANPAPGVLPIVGPALIGKSTLVEHVCNDERVRGHFSLILLHAAAGSAGVGDLGTMAALRDKCATKHQSNTEDERWLLVIELSGDVDDEAWNSLWCSPGRGRRCMPLPWGSKVTLTSRSEKIERFGTTRAVRLRCLTA